MTRSCRHRSRICAAKLIQMWHVSRKSTSNSRQRMIMAGSRTMTPVRSYLRWFPKWQEKSTSKTIDLCRFKARQSWSKAPRRQRKSISSSLWRSKIIASQTVGWIQSSTLSLEPAIKKRNLSKCTCAGLLRRLEAHPKLASSFVTFTCSNSAASVTRSQKPQVPVSLYRMWKVIAKIWLWFKVYPQPMRMHRAFLKNVSVKKREFTSSTIMW